MYSYSILLCKLEDQLPMIPCYITSQVKSIEGNKVEVELYWRQKVKFATGSGLFVAVKEDIQPIMMELRDLMVTPNNQQMVKLNELRSIVLDIMLDMEVWNK